MRPQKGDWFEGLLVLIFVITIAVVLVAVFSGPHPYQSDYYALGAELRFPPGWTPVLAIYNSDHNEYQFICEQDRVYRYCTPETGRG